MIGSVRTCLSLPRCPLRRNHSCCLYADCHWLWGGGAPGAKACHRGRAVGFRVYDRGAAFAVSHHRHGKFRSWRTMELVGGLFRLRAGDLGFGALGHPRRLWTGLPVRPGGPGLTAGFPTLVLVGIPVLNRALTGKRGWQFLSKLASVPLPFLRAGFGIPVEIGAPSRNWAHYRKRKTCLCLCGPGFWREVFSPSRCRSLGYPSGGFSVPDIRVSNSREIADR